MARTPSLQERLKQIASKCSDPDTTDALDRIIDELEGHVADTALLNFIERHPELTLRCRRKRWAFVGPTNYEYPTHPTLRDAVKTAMDDS